MASLLYYKYNACMFLDRSGFKVPLQILTKKRRVAVLLIKRKKRGC